MSRLLIFLSLLFSLHLPGGLRAQEYPFNIELEAIPIDGLGGLQSYAFGQSAGKWLIVGGRLDGLHRRQPFASFDIAGHNDHLIVVDPILEQSWKVPVQSLPASMAEQLSSTNMQFYQEEDILYLVGGYGYSPTSGDHITFDKLTAIDVPATIRAITEGKSIEDCCRQIANDQFAVTGGRLEKIYDTFYLVGGQKFTGRYNPMGPGHGPGFVQEYTNQIRRFRIIDNGTTIQFTQLPAWTDNDHLHRRDFNVVPQLFENEEEGLIAFSGVFQKEVDLPYLTAVHIDSSGYRLANAFNQLYNHYHCANVSLYSRATGFQHTVFFGGMAQFFEAEGTLVEDIHVPFVQTIAVVSRDKSGHMQEVKLPVEMPGLQGAGAEFIPAPSIKRYPNNVLMLDSLPGNRILIGYIFGGIESTAPNIFFSNTGVESVAGDHLFKVFMTKNTTLNQSQVAGSTGNFQLLNLRPNPTAHEINADIALDHPSLLKIGLMDPAGNVIFQNEIGKLPEGNQSIKITLPGGLMPGIYYIQIETEHEMFSRKLIVNP